MKFLSLVRHPESYRATPMPAGFMEAMRTYMETSLKDGSLVDTGGLLPTSEGARVRLSNGELSVTDGPFSEAKEVIGGWAILNAPTKADAIRMTTAFMELHRKHWPGFEGECEPGAGPGPQPAAKGDG